MNAIFIDSACPKCGKSGSLTFTDRRERGFVKDYIDCGQCGVKLDSTTVDNWEELMKKRIKPI